MQLRKKRTLLFVGVIILAILLPIAVYAITFERDMDDRGEAAIQIEQEVGEKIESRSTYYNIEYWEFFSSGDEVIRFISDRDVRDSYRILEEFYERVSEDEYVNVQERYEAKTQATEDFMEKEGLSPGRDFREYLEDEKNLEKLLEYRADAVEDLEISYVDLYPDIVSWENEYAREWFVEDNEVFVELMDEPLSGPRGTSECIDGLEFSWSPYRDAFDDWMRDEYPDRCGKGYEYEEEEEETEEETSHEGIEFLEMDLYFEPSDDDRVGNVLDLNYYNPSEETISGAELYFDYSEELDLEVSNTPLNVLDDLPNLKLGGRMPSPDKEGTLATISVDEGTLLGYEIDIDEDRSSVLAPPQKEFAISFVSEKLCNRVGPQSRGHCAEGEICNYDGKCYSGDLTGDGKITFADYRVFSEAWHNFHDGNDFNEDADLTGDGKVTTRDFGVFTEVWRETVDIRSEEW